MMQDPLDYLLSIILIVDMVEQVTLDCELGTALNFPA
jgi:hypothetical protein